MTGKWLNKLDSLCEFLFSNLLVSLSVVPVAVVVSLYFSVETAGALLFFLLALLILKFLFLKVFNFVCQHLPIFKQFCPEETYYDVSEWDDTHFFCKGDFREFVYPESFVDPGPVQEVIDNSIKEGGTELFSPCVQRSPRRRHLSDAHYTSSHKTTPTLEDIPEAVEENAEWQDSVCFTSDIDEEIGPVREYNNEFFMLAKQEYPNDENTSDSDLPNDSDESVDTASPQKEREAGAIHHMGEFYFCPEGSLECEPMLKEKCKDVIVENASATSEMNREFHFYHPRDILSSPEMLGKEAIKSPKKEIKGINESQPNTPHLKTSPAVNNEIPEGMTLEGDNSFLDLKNGKGETKGLSDLPYNEGPNGNTLPGTVNSATS